MLILRNTLSIATNPTFYGKGTMDSFQYGIIQNLLFRKSIRIREIITFILLIHTLSIESRLLSKNLKIKIYKTIILPVVLYGCETWSLTLREDIKGI